MSNINSKLQRLLRLGLALSFVWESARGWTIANIVLVFVQGLLPMLTLYLTKLVIDTVTAEVNAITKTDMFGEVAVMVFLLGLVQVVTSLVGSGAQLVSQAQSLAVTDHMQDIIHAKSVAVDLAYYEDPRYYDTLRRAQQEAPYRPTRILNNLTQLGQNLITLLAMVGLLLSLHWAVSIVLVVTVIPGVLVKTKYSRKLYYWQRQRTSTERRAAYFNWMLTGDRHAKEIRLFGLGDLFIERYRDLRELLRREQLGIAARRSALETLIGTGSAVVMYGVFGFIAYQAVEGRITVGDLVMYYQAFQRAQGALRQFLNSLASLYEDSLFLANMYEFLDLEPKVKDPLHPRPVPRPIRTGIVFDHVNFRYPDGKEVLKDVNLTIRPGEKIALVGRNGSGKTTLIKLMCRLYDPTSGTISVDGVDLRDFETVALRREISIILQDYAHYNLTARENIWFGNVELPTSHDRIQTAAEHAGADTLIAGLSQGYETTLGKWFEDGEELSIGEWQKIALARAFVRDAQVVVLDEPTSSMDAKAEYEVFKRFRLLTEHQTAVLISHRFSTVRMADRIFVLDDGCIVEHGTHDELVHCGGMYAHLFEIQAQSYR
jgi:ATP-binding cassette, subfamily B, bacterial